MHRLLVVFILMYTCGAFKDSPVIRIDKIVGDSFCFKHNRKLEAVNSSWDFYRSPENLISINTKGQEICFEKLSILHGDIYSYKHTDHYDYKSNLELQMYSPLNCRVEYLAKRNNQYGIDFATVKCSVEFRGIIRQLQDVPRVKIVFAEYGIEIDTPNIIKDVVKPHCFSDEGCIQYKLTAIQKYRDVDTDYTVLLVSMDEKGIFNKVLNYAIVNVDFTLNGRKDTISGEHYGVDPRQLDVRNCDDKNFCLHGGKCVSIGDEKKCRCVGDYIGLHCHEKGCPEKNPCGEFGKCVIMAIGVTCKCTEGHAGRYCNVDSVKKMDRSHTRLVKIILPILSIIVVSYIYYDLSYVKVMENAAINTNQHGIDNVAGTRSNKELRKRNRKKTKNDIII